MRVWSVVALCVGLLGCEQDKSGDSKSAAAETATEAKTQPTKPSAQQAAQAKAALDELGKKAAVKLPAKAFAVVPFDRGDVKPDMKHKGTLRRGLRYRDNNGDNFVLFSTIDKDTTDGASRYLYVRHYIDGPEGLRKARDVRDRVEDCQFDLTGEFIDKAARITDLDGDGLGEITFAYRFACRSDVSEATLKLLVIEDGDKYIIRGTTRVAGSGGAMRIDDSLKNGPAVFLAHAKKVWADIVDE